MLRLVGSKEDLQQMGGRSGTRMTVRRERRQERKARLRFLCVDCRKDTLGGEYYMVGNEVWAASGLGPNDGMLCLNCLSRRIGRILRPEDFTAMCPSKEIWQAYLQKGRTG